MFDTLLVPLDGSDRAEAVLPYVEGLASCFGAMVVLLQVVEPGVAFTTPYDVYPELNLEAIEQRKEAGESYLAKVAGRLAEKKIESQLRIEVGPVVQTILEVAAAEQAELIAMASHGRTGLGRVLYGSVASGVLHGADRPLFLIRSI
jgi:nucleotide-binding universal stress UspA family protein